MKLVNDRGWTAHSHQVKEMLGLDSKKKLPAEGMAVKVIQGIKVYINPLDPKRSARRAHRVIAICPECEKHMSAGRLHQHVCNFKVK